MFNVLICGPDAVGKTSICRRFDFGVFKEDHVSTIGSQFLILNVCSNSNQVKLVVFDLASQSQSLSHLSNLDAIILVFDVTREETITSAEEYFQDELTRFTGIKCFFLVGNKNELEQEVDVSSIREAIRKCFPDYKFILTSAKEDTNITELFEKVADCILQNTSI